MYVKNTKVSLKSFITPRPSEYLVLKSWNHDDYKSRPIQKQPPDRTRNILLIVTRIKDEWSTIITGLEEGE